MPGSRQHGSLCHKTAEQNPRGHYLYSVEVQEKKYIYIYIMCRYSRILRPLEGWAPGSSWQFHSDYDPVRDALSDLYLKTPM